MRKKNNETFLADCSLCGAEITRHGYAKRYVCKMCSYTQNNARRRLQR